MMTWIISNKLDDRLDKLIDGSITEITSNASNIRAGAFYLANTLTAVNCPYATTVGEGAFNGCANLATVSLPTATYINSSAFSGCTSLTSVVLPSVTDTGRDVFYDCTNLTSVSLPELLTMNRYIFQYCNKLTSVNVPKATHAEFSFSVCNQLTFLDFPSLVYIGRFTFNSCTSLNTMVLRVNQVCTLELINAFQNTPFASGGAGGTLYVPQALISSYKSANNWSTILGYPNNKILAIEGSPYE